MPSWDALLLHRKRANYVLNMVVSSGVSRGGAQGARAPPSALTKYSILCANTLMAQPQHLPDYFQS